MIARLIDRRFKLLADFTIRQPSRWHLFSSNTVEPCVSMRGFMKDVAQSARSLYKCFDQIDILDREAKPSILTIFLPPIPEAAIASSNSRKPTPLKLKRLLVIEWIADEANFVPWSKAHRSFPSVLDAASAMIEPMIRGA
ncbi:MAG TPA: hypothetical protein VID27_03235 [Blastocatellia bacterium]|jgi:hypothetical protein